jgi:hypothetical protein
MIEVIRRLGRVGIACGCLALSVTSSISGPLPEGVKTVSLVTASGDRLDIGKALFTADGDGAKFEVRLDAPLFGEEFLSMRPFRCLPDPKEMWCYLSYPYATKARIAADDLMDLEYALLFLFKPPAGYGIDAWNGLYFKLALRDDGAISGDVYETDFNILAAPPDVEFARPITHSGLTKTEPTAHRFSRIEVK